MKETTKNIIGVILFYLAIVAGVLAIDYKFSHEEQQKSAIERVIQIAQKQNS
jgi:hypothetical protein